MWGVAGGGSKVCFPFAEAWSTLPPGRPFRPSPASSMPLSALGLGGTTTTRRAASGSASATSSHRATRGIPRRPAARQRPLNELLPRDGQVGRGRAYSIVVEKAVQSRLPRARTRPSAHLPEDFRRRRRRRRRVPRRACCAPRRAKPRASSRAAGSRCASSFMAATTTTCPSPASCSLSTRPAGCPDSSVIARRWLHRRRPRQRKRDGELAPPLWPRTGARPPRGQVDRALQAVRGHGRRRVETGPQQDVRV